MMITEKPVHSLQINRSEFLKQWVKRVKLSRFRITAPASLHKNFCFGIFFLEKDRNMSRKALLNGVHTEFYVSV